MLFVTCLFELSSRYSDTALSPPLGCTASRSPLAGTIIAITQNDSEYA